MLKYKSYKKLGIVFFLACMFLMGCSDNMSDSNNELSNNAPTIEANVLKVLDDRIIIQKTEVETKEDDDDLEISIQKPDDDVEETIVFFADEVNVEIMTVVNGDLENPIMSEGKITDISYGDGIRIYGSDTSNEFFADRIVIIRNVSE